MASTNLKVVPNKEETSEGKLNSLIRRYADLQQEETEIAKIKKLLMQEIEHLFPIIPAGEKEVEVVVDGVKAKSSYPYATIIDPERLWALEAYRDTFWRIVKIPVTEAQNILPGDVFHDIARVEVSPIPKVSIRRDRKKD